MALSDRSRESLLPSFLYASSARSFAAASPARSFPAPAPAPASAAAAGAGGGGAPFSIQAPKEKIELYSPAFYAACTAGGIASCGLTHMAVTPLDLVKCNMQVSGAAIQICRLGAFGAPFRGESRADLAVLGRLCAGLGLSWASDLHFYALRGPMHKPTAI
jgi:hypothetical protein